MRLNNNLIRKERGLAYDQLDAALKEEGQQMHDSSTVATSETGPSGVFLLNM
jgi:hypothetical protein